MPDEVTAHGKADERELNRRWNRSRGYGWDEGTDQCALGWFASTYRRAIHTQEAQRAELRPAQNVASG